MARRGRQHSSDDRHERPSVTVDVVVFRVMRGVLEVLLIERREPPFKRMWALPGGFVGIDEGLEDAACRELHEETGVSDTPIEQLAAFGDPDRDPRGRVITVAYFALLPPDEPALKAGDDAAKAGWFPLLALPPLAFDHQQIVECAACRLRRETTTGDVASRLLPAEFTLAELQSVHEAVRGVRLDKRNFRRRVLSTGILIEMGRCRAGEGRPARLYAYRPGDGGGAETQ